MGLVGLHFSSLLICFEKMLYMNKSLEALTSAFEDDTFILLAVLLNYNYCYRFSKDSVGC